jgi:hypothetical protein
LARIREKPIQEVLKMDGKKFVVIMIAGMPSTALPAFSQSESPGKNEVPVQVLGSFVKSATFNGTQNSATDSQTRAAFVCGGAADRATPSAEPSIGFGYRF